MLLMYRPVEKAFISHSYFEAYKAGVVFMAKELNRKDTTNVNSKRLRP